MVRKVLFVALLLVAVALVAASPEDMINAQAKDWVAKFNAGDAKALAALYTTDAVVMPPDAPSVTGTEAIAGLLAPFFSGDVKMTISITPTYLEVHGNSADRAGTWSIAAPDGTVVDKGKFMELWKKSDKSWLMTHDIWNSDMPRPTAAK